MSHSIEPEYLLAAFLSAAERRDLETRAGTDSKATREIEASDRLKEALDSASRLESRALDDALLAFVTLGSRQHGHGWRARILDRIGSDPTAIQRLKEIEARAASLQQGHGADAHFEQLTGRSASRPPSSRWIWISAAAAVAILLVSGVTMRSIEDPVARAVWSQYPSPQVTRGTGNTTSDIMRAREMAYASRSSLLGLWPRYNEELLAQAEDLLAGRADPAALFELARIQLLRREETRALLTLDRLMQSAPGDAQLLLGILAVERDR